MKEIKFLGTTSFIISDYRVANVKFLEEKVDIVQLLYLDSNDFELEIRELINVKKNMEYVAHMPIDLDLSLDKGWNKLEKFIKKTSELQPKSYIIHPKNHKNFFKNLAEYKQKYSNICVENIDEIDFFNEILDLNCNICFDAGHAILNNTNIHNFIKKFGKNITTYHLHGIKNAKDHNSLIYFSKDTLRYLLDFASEKNIDVIIEVFGIDDFNSSMNFLRGFFKENDYTYHRWG